MNILILGGAGFIGNNLIRKCLEKGKHRITVVDSLDPRLKSGLDNLEDILSKIKFIKGDIRDRKLMTAVVKNQEVIINCAAQTSHPLSLKDPFFDLDINCHGTLTLLETVKEVNPKTKVVYVSSSTVIGKAVGEIIDEKHGEKPLDIYSANKGIAEKYHYIYHRVYGLKTLSLRFANIFGPYGKGSPEFGFINYFIDLAYNNKEIPIYGTGQQIRNVMYVEDTCDLLYKSIFQDNIFGDTYFAVHREHYSVLEIAKNIVSVFKNGKIRKIPWPEVRKKIEIDDVFISGAKLFYKIKWEPRYNLKEGLIKTKLILDRSSL